MRFIIISCTIFICLQVSGQTFLSFDQASCGGTVHDTYTYSNYTIGSHTNGYYIYRNGTPVYHQENGLGPMDCEGLIFINDSVGFLTEFGPPFGQFNMEETEDYGVTWNSVGYGAPGVPSSPEFFAVNKHTGYLLTFAYDTSLFITKTSDVRQREYILSADLMTKDTNLTDTIFGPPLCPGQKYLAFEILNASNDTIKDTIFFYTYPLSVNTLTNQQESIIVYPNPVSDQLFFSPGSFKNKIQSVTLYNVEGQIVLQEEKVDINNNSIYTGNLPDGIYCIVFQGQNSVVTKKFIKE